MIITRQITGPIESPDHEAVTSGSLSISLLTAIADEDTFIAPIKLNYPIVDGELPADCAVVSDATYELRILDVVENKIWSFQVCVSLGDGSPISVAQLYLLHRLATNDCVCAPGCETLDAANLGSDSVEEGLVLTSDGTGGTYWEEITNLVADLGYGDMFKAVYDTNNDGRVNAADHATLASLANDSNNLGGYPPSAYHPKIVDATTEGAVLTWDDVLQEYTPNENFVIGPGGDITFGDIYIDGSLYGNTSTVNQVYYEIDEETHILVVVSSDAEIVLPNPVTEDRRIINIKRTSSSQYDVTVSVIGGGLVEGSTEFILRHKYDAITCVAIDGEWWIY